MPSPAASPANQVFINCPFDTDYAPTFEALVFVVHFCGFSPRSARELDDASQTRIEKLYGIIEQCRYGIHDLSRTELDRQSGLPRFNMPLELGIFLGAKHFGGEIQRTKRCLILDVEQYRYQKFISDLNGMDIQGHQGSVEIAIGQVRDWLANVSRRRLSGPVSAVEAYRRFMADKPKIARGLGFKPNQIPYFDYVGIVTEWLLEAKP